MRPSKHTGEPATADHRQNILRQEEIHRKIEEAKYLTGGHRLGDATPGALLRPRHVGLTSAEEHTIWLQEISRWQREYRAVLAGLERVQAFVLENQDALRKRAEILADMIAEHDAMTEEYEVLKAKHLRARSTYEQAAEHHDKVMRRVRSIAIEIRDTFRTPGNPERQRGCEVEPKRPYASQDLM